MLILLSAIGSLLSFRVRSRLTLELELVALRHQLTVLRRQSPGRPRLFSADRLLWAWLYRFWPQVLDAMVLVKPATVVQWHRKGFRLYWRRRSRHLGRPRMNCELRDLIRKMSRANPLWGAQRIHGELLKLGIEVSQATVGRYLPWRPKVPSPTWRSFLHNHMHDTAAVDMFVVVTATFQFTVSSLTFWSAVISKSEARPPPTAGLFRIVCPQSVVVVMSPLNKVIGIVLMVEAAEVVIVDKQVKVILLLAVSEILSL